MQKINSSELKRIINVVVGIQTIRIDITMTSHLIDKKETDSHNCEQTYFLMTVNVNAKNVPVENVTQIDFFFVPNF